MALLLVSCARGPWLNKSGVASPTVIPPLSVPMVFFSREVCLKEEDPPGAQQGLPCRLGTGPTEAMKAL